MGGSSITTTCNTGPEIQKGQSSNFSIPPKVGHKSKKRRRDDNPKQKGTHTLFPSSKAVPIAAAAAPIAAAAAARSDDDDVIIMAGDEVSSGDDSSSDDDDGDKRLKLDKIRTSYTNDEKSEAVAVYLNALDNDPIEKGKQKRAIIAVKALNYPYFASVDGKTIKLWHTNSLAHGGRVQSQNRGPKPVPEEFVKLAFDKLW